MNDAKLYVGIDLARRASHKAVALKGEEAASPQAARSKPVSFSHDREGFLALRDRLLEQAGAASLKGVTVNLEPTSGVWETVAGFLRAQGAEVFFTRTDVVSALRKVHSKFAKTDRIDARTLAGIPRSFPERLVPVVEVEERIGTLRQLSAQGPRRRRTQTRRPRLLPAQTLRRRPNPRRLPLARSRRPAPRKTPGPRTRPHSLDRFSVRTKTKRKLAKLRSLVAVRRLHTAGAQRTSRRQPCLIL